MDRVAAARKIAALRAVTTARGATQGEADTAARLADRLVKAFGLASAPNVGGVRGPPRAPHTPTPSPADIAAMREAFRRMSESQVTAEEAMRRLADDWFDPSTGEAGPNVKVHEYRDHANWRVEYPR